MAMRPSRGRSFRPEVLSTAGAENPSGATHAFRGGSRGPQGLLRICGQAGTVCVVGRIVMPVIVG
jgi:Zn-dependent oligopeptidase